MQGFQRPAELQTLQWPTLKVRTVHGSLTWCADNWPVDNWPVDNWPADNWPVDNWPVDNWPVTFLRGRTIDR